MGIDKRNTLRKAAMENGILDEGWAKHVRSDGGACWIRHGFSGQIQWVSSYRPAGTLQPAPNPSLGHSGNASHKKANVSRTLL